MRHSPGTSYSGTGLAIEFPRQYNAAFDFVSRNLESGRAEKCAYIDDHAEYSFRDLDERSACVASLLPEMGLRMEQRVFVCMDDTFELPCVFLGAIRAGIVPVLVNTMLTATDYAWMLTDSRAPVAIVSASLAVLFEPLLETIPTFKKLIVSGDRETDLDVLINLLSGVSPAPTIAPTLADDVCFWLYSSGSTGLPKGTLHAHSSLAQTAELYAHSVLKMGEQDIVYSAAKLFFAYGLGNSLSFPLSVGATTILTAEKPTPEAVFARLQNYRATVFFGVPTLYGTLLASPALPPADELKTKRYVSAGEALPEDIARRWRDHFGISILDGIGSTEMLHIFISNRTDDVRFGTSGKPVLGYEARVVDERGVEVPNGEIGELHIAGPTRALMYWNNREKSQSTFLGRWTRTGDKYRIDEAGYYVYCGRSDDMLKVGGIYVSPVEVEAALISHTSVREAAVVGRADSESLIKPAAYVVLESGEQGTVALADELRSHVKSSLAPYKYPRWIEFVSDLPKTATGKIQRFKLRDFD